MSIPTPIKASGVPFVPELRGEQNREQLNALFAQFQKLDADQVRSFAAFLFGALEAMSCYEFCTSDPKDLISAIEGAINSTKPKELKP